MAIFTKEQLRNDYAEKRNRLDPALRQRDSAAIRHRLLGLEAWKNARSVLAYVSAGTEVETIALMDQALTQKKRLVVPVRADDAATLELSELKSLEHLIPGRWRGIREPDPAFRSAVAPEEIDLVIIPGTVFDTDGGRIGRGGGYYDRLIPRMPRAWRVGLAYALQILPPSLPLEEHDQRMHLIITEASVLEISTPAPAS